MNCEWVKTNIQFHVYDELADDARYELERHIEQCPQCAAELAAMQEFKLALSAAPEPELTPDLLSSSRLRLHEALENKKPGLGWSLRSLDPAPWLHQIKLAPAAAALLFLIGFGAGIAASYPILAPPKGAQVEQATATSAVEAVPPAEGSILGIQNISQEPDSRQVGIKYDAVVPQTVTGSPDDPQIQQLLMFAARNADSGMRVDSVDLLARRSENERIRRALIHTLRHDSNPGVRLKALSAVGQYVKGDLLVRDAVLQALLGDRNSGVRTEALKIVQPVRADATVRLVLEHVASEDQSPAVRDMSRSLLASMPQIE